MIPFNKPCLTGKEAHYMYQAVYNKKLSGNGVFTKKCQNFFMEHLREFNEESECDEECEEDEIDDIPF